jgi:peptidoglycan/xylan/chitin deacetylase (PgdA/CDA1 family)
VKLFLYSFVRRLGRLVSPQKPRGGIVSLTFDDQWHSAYCNALPLLERYEFKSTWYICVSNVGKYDNDFEERYLDWEEIRNLNKLNHEIASHTMTHLDFDCADINTIRSELADSKRILMSKIGCQVNSFAYPFTHTGVSNDVPKAVIAQYATARGGDQGLNGIPLRKGRLFAWRLYENRCSIDYLKALVDICRIENKWLIFYTHDVKANPSAYGCTPELFDQLLHYLRTVDMNVDTVNQVGKSLS